MDEYDFYQGTHSGGEIDRDLDVVDVVFNNSLIFATPLPEYLMPTITDPFAGYQGTPYCLGVSNADLTLDDDIVPEFDKQYKLSTKEAVTNAYRANNVLAKSKCVKVAFSSVSSLPKTGTQLQGAVTIDDSFVCIGCVLSNPAAQAGAWTITTSDGSVTVSGSIVGTTDIILYLAKREDINLISN